jgi:hypothetical protein
MKRDKQNFSNGNVKIFRNRSKLIGTPPVITQFGVILYNPLTLIPNPGSSVKLSDAPLYVPRVRPPPRLKDCAVMVLIVNRKKLKTAIFA